MSNRFEKLRYNPNEDTSTSNETPIDHINNNQQVTSDSVTSNTGMNLNIHVNESLEKKVPSNYTLYPSQKKKLSELSKIFRKSGSTILGEVIDQLYDEYKK